MAGSGSYSRGEQPRSVPDPDRASYKAMLVKQRALNAAQEAEEFARRTAIQPGQALRRLDEHLDSHPGTAESLIPMWGSAREAIADAREGDVGGATINGVAAVGDLAGGTALVKGLAKGGLKLAGPHTWKKVREWMGPDGTGMLKPNQPGHHWMVERNRGLGKRLPDWLKNQPPNIKPTQNAEVHGRLHHRVGDKPRFNTAERFWYGTPTWWKGGLATAPGHVAASAQEELNPAARDDRPQRARR